MTRSDLVDIILDRLGYGQEHLADTFLPIINAARLEGALWMWERADLANSWKRVALAELAEESND